MGGDSISVVIITYNHVKFIRECIESVLSQTLKPYEIIICDDCSTDGTWDIVSEYARRYPNIIKAYCQERNVGPYNNADFGRRMVKGEFICFIEGDDRWLPRKLEAELEALKRFPGAQVAYSNVYLIDEEGRRIQVWYDGKGHVPPSGDVFIHVYARTIFPNSKSVFRNEMLTRLAHDEEGRCDETLESFWDWERKIRLSHRYPVVYSGEANSSEALVEYRTHKGGFHRKMPEKQFKAMVKAYEKHLPLLENRSMEETIWVRCNVETLLASHQLTLPHSARLPFYSAYNVYRRIEQLFQSLPEHNRLTLRKRLSPVFAQLARLVTNEMMQVGDRRKAMEYWLRYLWYRAFMQSG